MVWLLVVPTVTALVEVSIFLSTYWRPVAPTAVGKVSVKAALEALPSTTLSEAVRV